MKFTIQKNKMIKNNHSGKVINNLHSGRKSNLEDILGKIEFYEIDIRYYDKLSNHLVLEGNEDFDHRISNQKTHGNFSNN